MAIPIDAEPRPRPAGDRPVAELKLVEPWSFPQAISVPAAGLLDVLARRRSRIGGGVADDLLGSLLWHSTQLRERRFDGRFGRWESRAAPSAGGIHPIRLLILPLDREAAAGIYDDARHALGATGHDPSGSLDLNRASVAELTGATEGTTIQLFANPSRLASCYDSHESLLWRDAGALIGILCLVAEALDLTAVPLGRHGLDIVRAFGLSDCTVGLGGVHVGSPVDAPRN